MNEAEFVAFLSTSLRLLARFSTDGSVHFICMDWRHLFELLSAGKQIYDTLLNLCVWAKDNGGMGSFYRSQHEMIFVFDHLPMNLDLNSSNTHWTLSRILQNACAAAGS